MSTNTTNSRVIVYSDRKIDQMIRHLAETTGLIKDNQSNCLALYLNARNEIRADLTTGELIIDLRYLLITEKDTKAGDENLTPEEEALWRLIHLLDAVMPKDWRDATLIIYHGD